MTPASFKVRSQSRKQGGRSPPLRSRENSRGLPAPAATSSQVQHPLPSEVREEDVVTRRERVPQSGRMK